MNDISDGLSREANEIAYASGIAMDILEDAIPLSWESQCLGKELGQNPLDWAWNGGEDYQLVGTISPENYENIKAVSSITIIGKVRESLDSDVGVYVMRDHRSVKMTPHGYDHFQH